MYSTLLRHCLYPFGEKLIGTSMIKRFEQAKKTQWWTSERLIAHQTDALKALIEHAYRNVPYYRDLFKERGLTNDDIQTPEDLQKLPILTKTDIRRNYRRLFASDFSRWRPFHTVTSGSTGEPLDFYISVDSISMNWACLYRGWTWAGYELGNRVILLGGASLIPKDISLQSRVRYLIERKTPLSSFGMTARKIEDYVTKMSKIRPLFLYGYPSAIAALARHLVDRSDSRLNLKAVFTSAESLMPGQRTLIERAFGCKVFDQYGCYDGGVQALECHNHEGYHISEDKAIVELLDERANVVSLGNPGEIVSTDLYNYAMPFIRYATGDIGIRSSQRCPCGRSLPLLESIQGRIADQVTLRDGTRISGLPLGDVFEDIEKEKSGSVSSYQIVQKGIGLFQVRIVPGSSYSEKDGRRIAHEMRKHMGEHLDIQIELVSEIPLTKAGKFRFIITEMDDTQ